MKTRLVLGLVGGLMMSSVAWAQPRPAGPPPQGAMPPSGLQGGPMHGGPGGHGGHPLLRALRELDLRPEQREQLRKLHEANRGTGRKLYEELRALRQSLREAMAGTANEQQCGALHTQVQQKQAEVATFRFQRMLEMRRVLTPDQRQRLVTLLEEQRFGGGGHGGGWHDRDDE